MAFAMRHLALGLQVATRAARALGLAALGVTALGATNAQAVDIFSAAGIKVDVSAESAVAARAQAIEAGERDALREVLRRLTLPGFFDRLPSVEGLDLTRLVRSFEVESEKVSATRYVAAISVAFDGEAVRNLVRPTGVPIVLGPSEPLLIVPAVERSGQLDIWSDASSWRDAWSQEALRNTLLDIRLALGDLPDIASLPAGLPREALPDALAQLATRYGTSAAVLVVARSIDVPRRALARQAQPVDKTGADEPQTLEVEIASSQGWPAGAASFKVDAGDGSAEAGDIWRQAARRSMLALEDAWKPENLVRFGEAASLSLTVPLVDLDTWVQIQRQLEGVPEVQKVDIESFSRKEAIVQIAYVGGLQQLGRAMGARGLQLVEEASRWLLQPAADRPGGLAQ